MEQKKILVIDDEKDICSILKIELEATNFNVKTVLSGKKGLEIVKEFNPDIIILDLMMPEMDGFEVCGQLKQSEITSSIPIVVLTAIDQEEAVKKAFDLGASGYLIKPFEDKSVLLFAIEKFLK
jgi:adenylate cyclase